MSMEGVSEKAKELGRLIGQTEEYKALQRARERFSEDREAVTRVNRLAELEALVGEALQRGVEPTEEIRTEYEALFAELQASPVYQGMVAGQSNFDRVLQRVNEDISKGIEAGAASRIILTK
ncbi:MAG TPA: YlbF family regulator [Longimicrobiales bacterium]